MSINRVELLGYLGKDPEVRYSKAGDAITSFSLATNEEWKGKTGKRETRTEWHRVVVFGALADTVQSYLKKGSQVFVEGRLQTKHWESQDGQKRSGTEVVAGRIQFLDRGRKEAVASVGGGEGEGGEAVVHQPLAAGAGGRGGDDVPF